MGKHPARSARITMGFVGMASTAGIVYGVVDDALVSTDLSSSLVQQERADNLTTTPFSLEGSATPIDNAPVTNDNEPTISGEQPESSMAEVTNGPETTMQTTTVTTTATTTASASAMKKARK